MNGVPKLDKRDAKQLLQEVKKLADQYTPEWNFDDRSSDFGVVLAKIFCHLFEGTINKYNMTSYNYYLTFLNMLGIKLRPASAASGMVIVQVDEGSGGTYIEKGSNLYAKSKKRWGDMIIYETQDNLFAVDTKITNIFFTEGKSDIIVDIYNAPKENDTLVEEITDEKIPEFKVFDTVYGREHNMQGHEIYFTDNIVFDMSKPDVTFSFFNNISEIKNKSLPEIFSDPKNVSWESFNGSTWEKAEKVEKVKNAVHVLFKNKPVQTKVNGKRCLSLRCRLDKIPQGDVFVTGIKYKSLSDKIPPDYLFCNDTNLSDNDFFPFEERYSMYNNFYFACEEALTKKGAQIEIDAQVQFVKVKVETEQDVLRKRFKYIMTDIDFADLEPSDVQIEEVVWEYWNGKGWAKLKVEEGGNQFFTLVDNRKVNKKLVFTCPDDIQSTMVGSGDGHFIRARISKLENPFETFSNYISPYIHTVTASYKYPDEGHVCREVFVKSNLDEKIVDVVNNGEVKILEHILCEHPAMYICLKNPLLEGTVRLFINIEEGIHRYNPAVKWEYSADDAMGGFKWRHMEVMDLTEDFSHSETVTLIGKKDFKKISLFGREGYFIRIVNIDDRYSGEVDSRPVIKDIKFNAVRISQRETHVPEYFSISRNEENKLCRLTRTNATNIVVWVDEIGKVNINEQEIFLNSPPDVAQAEYDELGNLEKLWVRWHPVSSLICAGMQDRVYEVDYSKGEVRFGDGKNGKIPPDQPSDGIKIEYSICNGSEGNVGPHEIKGFVSNLDNINSVDNLSPIMGGVDMETIDRAASRTFSHVSGGNRLVSLSDFENSICFNDRNIYKVRCLSHVDENSKPKIGITSIAVLPVDYMQGYEKFQGIKKRIWDFIDEKAPMTLSRSSKVRVFEVGYAETCVGLDVVIDDFNSYQGVYKEIRNRLKRFLDPVDGNFSREGWNIGEFPRKELIYNYIKVVKHIKWIKKINIFTKMITDNGKKEVAFEEIKKNKFVVPVFGEPEINISVH